VLSGVALADMSSLIEAVVVQARIAKLVNFESVKGEFRYGDTWSDGRFKDPEERFDELPDCQVRHKSYPDYHEIIVPANEVVAKPDEHRVHLGPTKYDSPITFHRDPIAFRRYPLQKANSGFVMVEPVFDVFRKHADMDFFLHAVVS
jgi:hypothetical protein